MRHLKRTWVEINIDNLQHNYEEIKRIIGDKTAVMGIVKADAYSHGSVPVALALQEFGVDWLGVSNIIEAKILRKAGVEKPILILGYTPIENATELFELNVSQTVFGAEYAEKLSAAAAAANVKINVHVKIDTGMSRLGFDCHDIKKTVSQIAKMVYLPYLKVTGIFTHFSVADEHTESACEFTQMQHDRFAQVLAELHSRGIEFAYVHCCNSAATLFNPEFHHNMVRPGIILYGLSPNGMPIEGIDLRPVMTLKSVVSLVKTINAGDSVSYGCTFTSDREMKIATVPMGYADGYPRAMSNRGFAWVNETVVPVVGAVCMDQLMLDVTDVEVNEGDEVIFFGGTSPISLDNVAVIAKTINYELMCGISRRVERVYVKNGDISEVVDYTL
ncbi:MAG: alanine racemase [Oscillospiraceae bacterium]